MLLVRVVSSSGQKGERSESERCGFDSALGFRLPAFGDLVTAGTIFCVSSLSSLFDRAHFQVWLMLWAGSGHLQKGHYTMMGLGMGLLAQPVQAVCPHCKDTIAGCRGGNDCPAFKDWTANAAIFKDNTLGTTPRVTHSLASVSSA